MEPYWQFIMKRFLQILIFFLILFGCKTYVAVDYDFLDETEESSAFQESLNQLVYLDTINFEMLEVSLPKKGYLTVDYARNLKFNLLKNAMFITENSNFNYYGNEGLAYVWGGKDHTKKSKPVRYRSKENKCQEELFGLDCSGFVYQIFLMSDFQFFSGDKTNPVKFADAEFFSKPVNWKNPMRKYCNGQDCLVIKRINKPAFDEIESGDILFFYDSQKTRHIGVCLEIENQLIFFDSGGYPNRSCSIARDKGPRRLKMSQGLLSRWKGKDHGIIRINNTGI